MSTKEIEKELLIKASKKDVKYILTHSGFVNNCTLSKGECELLNNLSHEMQNNDIAFVIDNKVFSPYITGYNGGYVLAGIKISTAVF